MSGIKHINTLILTLSGFASLRFFVFPDPPAGVSEEPGPACRWARRWGFHNDNVYNVSLDKRIIKVSFRYIASYRFLYLWAGQQRSGRKAI